MKTSSQPATPTLPIPPSNPLIPHEFSITLPHPLAPVLSPPFTHNGTDQCLATTNPPPPSPLPYHTLPLDSLHHPGSREEVTQADTVAMALRV